MYFRFEILINGKSRSSETLSYIDSMKYFEGLPNLKLIEFKKFCFSAFIFLLLFFFSIENHAEPIAKFSSFEDILPAGTRMVIPTEIMQEYQFVSKKWGHPFNYLSHYYSSLGPSTLHKDQHTYYIPLSREEDKQNTEQPVSRTVMVDLMNVKMNEESTVFTTRNTVNINNQPVQLATARFARKSPFLIQEDTQTEAGTNCINCVTTIAFNDDITIVNNLRQLIMPSLEKEPDFSRLKVALDLFR